MFYFLNMELSFYTLLSYFYFYIFSFVSEAHRKGDGAATLQCDQKNREI